MQSPRLRMSPLQITLLGIGVAALGLRAEAPSRVSANLDENQRAVLASSRHRKAQPQFDRGRADSNREIGYVTLMLKPSPSQEADLEQILAEQQDRSSPNYHRWLSPEEFGDRFGVSRQD